MFIPQSDIEASAREDLLRFHELIVRHELVRLIADLPGSIAQIGVGNGTGLLMLIRLHDIFATFQTSTQFYGFDSFTFYPSPSEDERSKVEEFRSSANNRFGDQMRAEVERQLDAYLLTSPFGERARKRFHLVSGLVEETLPEFNGPEIFKLVEIDVNLRHATRTAIEKFWPKITPGGVMVFGSYGSGFWEGEEVEVLSFLQREKLTARTVRGLHYPSSYVVKP